MKLFLELIDSGLKVVFLLIALFVLYIIGASLISGYSGMWVLVGSIIGILFLVYIIVPFLIRLVVPKKYHQSVLDWYFWRNR